MTINTIESLREHLQWAVEIEHGTLPPYLCALYSIEEGHNTEAAEVIHSVFMEEMLHLTLAANVLNAIGGSPVLDSPRLMPAYPAFLPHSDEAFQVPLAKFSPESVETFMKIERPSEHDGLPEDDSYETIGQFYEAVEEALVRLSGELGEDRVFSGDPSRQVTAELYYGGAGEIVAVSDLRSALAGLEEVIEQGEGLQHEEVWDGDQDMFHPERLEVAHYFRFDELRVGRRYQATDTPQSGPTGPELAVDWEAVHDMRPNPRCSDYPADGEVRRRMDEFNHTYSGILHLLDEAFNGSPMLLAVSTGAMYGLKEQARGLMSLPSGDGRTTAGPSFEYVPPEERWQAPREEKRIVVLAGGPYMVYGDVPLVRKRTIFSDNGDSLNWEKTEVIETEDVYALCRCGRSSTKPFCDGTHVRIGFEGSETADTAVTAARQRIYDGTEIVVKRDGSLCMHAGFCVARTRRIPEMMPDTGDSDVRAQIMGMIDRCPSGSYVYALEGGGADVEADLPAAIAVTEEKGSIAACLWVTGGIPVQRADGQPLETRNRVTLCRCGESNSKPLCDGTHREIEFRE
jgi:CDGSH-type Zn-finger protein